MTAPTRKPVIIAEATQELQATDVVGVLGTLESQGQSTAGVALPRKPQPSNSSIAPVGLDLKQGTVAAHDDDELGEATAGTIVPRRRRNLSKVVFAAIAACGVIIVAAGVARIAHANGESSSDAPSAAAGGGATPGPAAAAAVVPAAAATPAPAAVGATASATDPASAGTVRLSKPSLAGHVWLDGKKISATSVVVSCGTHQVKVGHGRKHSIDVPCGGEIAVGH
jgi:hypothetical protein